MDIGLLPPRIELEFYPTVRQSTMIDFFEFSNEMLCLANRQGYFTRVNQAWTTTLGWTSEEMISRPYFDFVHPEDREVTVREAAMLQTGSHETIRFENRYQCKNGEYKWLAWHAKLEPDSDQLVAAARDVTTQKLQAEALRESEEKFRHLALHAPVGIFLSDLAGRCLFVNQAWCEMSGMVIEQALGDGWRPSIYPEDEDRVIDEWGQAVRAGRPYTGEFRFLKPSGEVIWVQASAAPFLGLAGKAVSYIGTTVDITERIEAMAALTAEQNLLQQSIELQDRERQLIAYDIHDGLIQYATGALLHLLGYQAMVPAGENNELLEHAVVALRRTIAEGRRVMNGIRTPVLDEHGVVAAIHEFALERKTENTEIEFVPPAEDIGRLSAEREIAIYRMAQEAINNALKHSQSAKIRVSLEQDDECIRLMVKDWGVGIVDKEPSRGVHGLRGIKERVRLLNGTFKLESTAGRGTLIQIELPTLKSVLTSDAGHR